MDTATIDYEMLFSTMVIKPDWEEKLIAAAKAIAAKQGNYELTVEKMDSKMPWYFLGIVHNMECSLRFDRHLHNGDTLKYRTTHVPAGRPVKNPMNGFPAGYTWIESAIDAMQFIGFANMESWSLKEMLYRFEMYNGFGYEKYHNEYSPYLWAGTQFYSSGKYTRDGRFDPNLISEQVGAAPLLRYLTDKTLGIV